MAVLPYMQFYVADYLADTMHLTTEEHGAYLLLLMNYWQTGKPIPKSRLQKIARLSNDRWNSVAVSLEEFFNEDDSGAWVHARVEADLKSARDAQQQRVKAGKASAEAKKRAKLEKEKAASRPVDTGSSSKRTNGEATTVEQPLQRDSNENSTNKEQNRTEHKNNTSSPPTNSTDLDLDGGDASPTLSENFEVLWKSWPTDLGAKGSKADALAAFQKLKPDDQLITVIQQAVVAQAEHKRLAKSRDEFCENFQHVHRWLRKRRWEDEIPELEKADQDWAL